MNNDEIKALIEKYRLIIQDGKLGTYAKVNKADFMRDIPPHKAEIIEYIETEKKAAQEKREREEAIFNAIPGVMELREARRQQAAWKAAFNEMMDTGSSNMPYIEHKSPSEMEALETKYPMAVFALEAKSCADNAQNIRLSAIWNDTYQAIKDGQDIAAVKADHEARMNEYRQSVMFD